MFETTTQRVPLAARLAVLGMIALFLLVMLWETLLAPIRPGGSWLVLKTLPLALLIPAGLRGTRSIALFTEAHHA